MTETEENGDRRQSRATGAKPSPAAGALALSPIVVFLALYLATSVAIGDFYRMPVSIAFIVAVVWAIATTKGKTLAQRIDIFSAGAANPGILYMIWIFIMAGAFASLAKSVGAIDATVALTLQAIPTQFIIPGLFVAACFISLSVGTSVGTVVALTPFALQLAQSMGMSEALFVATGLGGSFFGDNLSFISDTTIAATRSQGCKMSDKFRANLHIALPAAIITLVLYIVFGQLDAAPAAAESQNYWLIVPYMIVIVTAIAGMNVLVVLTLGIVASIVIALACTTHGLVDMCAFMGDGIMGMGDLIVVTLLAAGLLNIIKHNGGIDCIIYWLSAKIHGQRGAQSCIALIVSVVNVCTANNTIAIITVGELARKIAEKFSLDPRKVASILDTCSCVVQSIIPYGAQALLAAGLSGLSPTAFIPHLYYTFALAAMVVLSIILGFPYSKKKISPPDGDKA